MAIDTCSEPTSSLGATTSPRISFSYDLHQTDHLAQNPYGSDSSIQHPNSDFDFCISNGIELQQSSADELFSGGLIRPIQLQNRSGIPSNTWSAPSLPPLPLPLPPPTIDGSTLEILKQTNMGNVDKAHPKSFWSIKRSSSLHCDNGHKKSSFWSLPLLSRSKSTGSVPTSTKQALRKNSAPSSSNSPSFYSYPPSQKKPPPKKNYGGGPYGNGVRFSPVLNVTSPCISGGTANLFGFGSFFRNGKDKRSGK